MVSGLALALALAKQGAAVTLPQARAAVVSGATYAGRCASTSRALAFAIQPRSAARITIESDAGGVRPQCPEICPLEAEFSGSIRSKIRFRVIID
jgi:hypothetical protein